MKRIMLLISTMVFFCGIAFSQNTITRSEYFIDNDPGPGYGHAISITPGDSLSASETFPTANLSSGYHYLFIRTYTDSMGWGLAQAQSFFINGEGLQNTIAEYFIDSDPGVGNGTSIPINSGDTGLINASFTDSNLSSGYHNLFIRSYAPGLGWSLAQAQSFFVNGPGVQVTNAEYFIDSDPGVGKGTAITLTPGDTLAISGSTNTAGLTLGRHYIFIRTFAKGSGWSIAQAQPFYIDTLPFPCSYTINTTAHNPTINGANNGSIDVSITDSTDNCGGTWSLSVYSQDTVPVIIPSCNCFVYQSNYAYPFSITDLSPGNYKLIGQNACGCKDTTADIVISNPVPQALSIINLPDSTAEGDTVVFKVALNFTSPTATQVFLSSGNPSEFPVPLSVIIPADSLSANVVVYVPQDSVPELATTATVQAGAANDTSVSGTIVVAAANIPGIKLTLQTDTISENGGPYATLATLLRTAGSSPAAFIANLSVGLNNTITIPSTVSLAAGQNDTTFYIGAVDNGVAGGYTNVPITADVYIPSCGCGAPSTSAGYTTDTLVISDNDGAAITLTAIPQALPTGVTSGTLRVSRNTSTNNALTVYLVSLDTNAVKLPASVTIPKGATYVDTNIRTLVDTANHSAEQVYLHATASGFSPGITYVTVSDNYLPDFQIDSASVSDPSIDEPGIINYNVSVVNTGFATAPPGVVVEGFLSTSNVLNSSAIPFSSDTIYATISVDSIYTISNAAIVSAPPGQYYLFFEVNPQSGLQELIYANNTSNPIPLAINAAYSVTASVNQPYFLQGTTVPITGHARLTDSAAAVNVPVEVYIITDGLRRQVMATTDSNGNFNTQFVPLARESGHYTVGASFPGLNATQEQADFDILGVSINGSATPQFLVTLGKPDTGTLSVQNLSNTNLTKFTLSPVSLPGGASIVFDTLAVLIGNNIATLGYTIVGSVVTPGLNYVNAAFNATSSQGVIQPFNAYYYCQSPQGYLNASITNINTTVSQAAGEQIVQFLLINSGSGPTGNIQISLPQGDWINTVTPATLPSIGPGDTGLVALRFLAAQDVPFNYPIQGTIAINASNANGIALPFTFEKVSDTTGTIHITAVDQYTFYSPGAPNVIGAQVTVEDYYSQQIYATGLTDSNGMFQAANLPPGTYQVNVTDTQHLPFGGTIVVSPGQVVDTAVFLNFQGITYSWTVTPTAIQDEYNITLTSQFQTNVPEPVVTIQMPDTMPELSGNNEYAFNVTLINHGLIAAKDLQLFLPVDSQYEFITNYVPADLGALSSIQVPVIMRLRSDSGSPAPLKPITRDSLSRLLGLGPIKEDPSSNCGGGAFILYFYICDGDSLKQAGGVTVTFAGRSCPGFPVGGGPITVTGNPLGGGGPVPVVGSIKNCDKCIGSIIGTLLDCSPALLVRIAYAGYSIYQEWMCLSNAKSNKQFLDCIPAGTINYALPCLPSLVNTISICVFDVDLVSTSINFLTHYNGVGDPAERLGPTGGGDSVLLAPSGSVYVEILNDLQVAYNAQNAYNEIAVEYQGNIINSDAWPTFFQYVQPYEENLDTISLVKQDSILAAMSGSEIPPDTIRAFFARWNTTVEAYNDGVFSPNAKYPNIIDQNVLAALADSLDSAEAYANARGFQDFIQMADSAYDELNIIINEKENSVCASVTVQLSQDLVLTRQAFNGSLTISNGNPVAAIDSLSVNILITDANGVPSNGLFQIDTISLTNMGNITGTGSIPAAQSGTVQFQFIPTIAAAPTMPAVYNFGGSVTYRNPYSGNMVTNVLAPQPLTVDPSPSLNLEYFMQRNILGDDPLTNHIEPSVPADLAIMIENEGYGPAVNIMVSSAQPQIVDNAKGLAIQFQLVGSEFQGQPENLGLTNINFGTIPPLQTRTGEWFFTSSLLGKFVSFSAQVAEEDSQGNAGISLVQNIRLHTLIQAIRVYGNMDDSINDFLVDDIPNINYFPDSLYLSQGNIVYPVYQDSAASFNLPVQAPTFTDTLTVIASKPGWNFLKIADPGNGNYKLVSVTRQDGQVIPLQNAWLTFVDLPQDEQPVYNNSFNFADTFPSLVPVTYTVVWQPANLDVPMVDSINGAPAQVTATAVTHLSVVFNEAIDTSTFTTSSSVMTLLFQGHKDSLNSAVITQIDTSTFDVDLTGITTGNGTYYFTVQTDSIRSINGIYGVNGKQVSWTQFVSVPAVQAFEGLPPGNIDSSFDTVDVFFNLPIDTTTVTPQRFMVYKNSVQLGTLTIDSISNDLRTFYLSGLKNILTGDGVYQLVVEVDSIKSTNEVQGMENQSVLLTVDNTGPEVVSLVPSDSGGVDSQNITYVYIHFNKNAFGFNTASVQLTRDGVPLVLNIDQLSIVSGDSIWLAGNFGLLTYPEGNYVFTVYDTGVTDALGNRGKETHSVTWSVNRSTTIAISDLEISPDLGYSDTDGVTSTLAFNVLFDLSDSASQVTIYQETFGTYYQVGTLQNVSPGRDTVPVVFTGGGNTAVEVVATSSNGGYTTAVKTLYLDQLALNAQWLFTAGQTLDTQVSSIPLAFSDRLLDSSAIRNAIQFTRNGLPLSTSGLGYEMVNDTEYVITNLESTGNLIGNYTLSVVLDSLKKYSSGLQGAGTVSTSWVITLPSDTPVANAGSNFTITSPGVYSLNGSASYDPNGRPLTYQWVVAPGISLNDSEVANPSFTIVCPDQGNVYSFVLEVSNGLFISSANVTGTIKLTNVVPPTISSNGPTTFCEGDSVTLSAGNGYSGYLWNNRDSSESINVKQTGDYFCTVTKNGCTAISDTVAVVATCAGIDNQTIENSISLYPNPTEGILVAQSPYFISVSPVSVQLYDITGKLETISYARVGDKIVFDTNALSAGMYWVKFSLDDLQINKKFVKMD